MSDGIKPLLTQQEITLAAVNSTFELEMGVYQTERFESLVSSDYVFSVPEMIFVKVDIQDVDTFQPTLKKCWATPS